MWIEKYRPTQLKEVIGFPTSLEGILTKEEIPHFLFYGPPGTGKTTTSRIIVKKLGGVVMEINASDERGIDVVRNKVKDFASVYSEGKRFIVLEEVDGLTPEAQNSLRNIMERFYSNCKFILTCNYISKVIEPIQSRCCKFEFSRPSKEEVVKRLEEICRSEKVVHENEAIIKIVEDSYPDIRSAINSLERSVINNEVKLSTLILPSKELEEIYYDIKQRKFNDLRKKLTVMSFDYPELYTFLFNKLSKNSIMKKELKTEIMIKLADRLYRDGYIANKEVNFLAGVIDIWRTCDVAGVIEI
jgi:DNA polymerase III delta prime subunit